jgi:hypothetical protein
MVTFISSPGVPLPPFITGSCVNALSWKKQVRASRDAAGRSANNWYRGSGDGHVEPQSAGAGQRAGRLRKGGSIPAGERDLSSEESLKVSYRTLNKIFQNRSNFQFGQQSLCLYSCSCASKTWFKVRILMSVKQIVSHRSAKYGHSESRTDLRHKTYCRADDSHTSYPIRLYSCHFLFLFITARNSVTFPCEPKTHNYRTPSACRHHLLILVTTNNSANTENK